MIKVIVLCKCINEVVLIKISFNDLVIKVCVVVLCQYLVINSFWLDDCICINKDVNIGVVVVVLEGLLVFVVCYVDIKILL